MPNCVCCSMKFTGSTSCKTCSGSTCSTCRNNGTYGVCCSCAGASSCSRTGSSLGGGGGGGGGGGYASESDSDSWMTRQTALEENEARPDCMYELEEAIDEGKTNISLKSEGWIDEIREKVDSDPNYFDKLVEFTCWNFGLTSLYADDLAAVLKGMKSLKTLQLGWANFGGHVWEELMEAISPLPIEDINIEYCNVGNEGMKFIAAGLDKMPNLKKVRFSSITSHDDDWYLDDDDKSDLSQEGMVPLLKVLAKKQLHTLDLSNLYENTDQPTIDALCDVIGPSLRLLNLNSLLPSESEHNVDKLMDAISRCTNLHTFKWGFALTESQAQKLAIGIVSMKKLREVECYAYEMKWEAQKHLFKAYAENGGIKLLECGEPGDDIPDDDIDQCKEWLTKIGTNCEKLRPGMNFTKKHFSRDERKAIHDYYLTDSDDDDSSGGGYGGYSDSDSW